jgi:hypothetical protein
MSDGQGSIGSFVTIGPECFADGSLNTISYKGENYYRACSEPVVKFASGAISHCVKRVNHKTDHEDWGGNMKKNDG